MTIPELIAKWEREANRLSPLGLMREVLERCINELRAASGWRPSISELPKFNADNRSDEVLVRGFGEGRKHYVFAFAQFEKTRTGTRWVDCRNFANPFDELHFEPVDWMPLPPPPQS